MSTTVSAHVNQALLEGVLAMSYAGSALSLVQAVRGFVTAPLFVTAGTVTGVALTVFIAIVGEGMITLPCCHRYSYFGVVIGTAFLCGIIFPLVFSPAAAPVMMGLNCSMTWLAALEIRQLYNVCKVLKKF